MLEAFRDRVDATRMAYVFAHDGTAYRRWRTKVERQTSRQTGLTGAALEAAVMALAQTHPEYVTFNGAPA